MATALTQRTPQGIDQTRIDLYRHNLDLLRAGFPGAKLFDEGRDERAGTGAGLENPDVGPIDVDQ